MGNTESFDAFLNEFAGELTKAGRKEGDVKLLPVSKGQDISRIRELLSHAKFPQRLGENYFGELESKSEVLPKVEWHFLGRLQSRKIGEIASIASVLHSVGRIKEIEALVEANRVPQFFLQVNISDEPQKGGFDPNEISQAIQIADDLGMRKNLLGFMGMAAELDRVGEKVVANQFGSLRILRDKLLPEGALSMGMSDDYPIALREGSNWIRVGTKIFGSRVAPA